MNFMTIDMDREYKEHWNEGVLQCVNTGNTSIPTDPNNMDYAYYLEWKRLGGVPVVIDMTVVKTTDDLRKEEYVKQGASTDALVVALWEKIVENRPEAADALQAIREQVKLDVVKE